ncbi:Vicianin hydrolase [Glycine soja]|uniref:Vicianin hydrolase n=1 Tax=Glycine soja TaxID=3848 RepID=A0A0B2SW01_GLYSO|nr:Vicianin hydrolase [Glycine soja]
MKAISPSFLCLIILVTLLAGSIESAPANVKPSHYAAPFNRSVFPSGFLFGIGSAAYQIEGAAAIDGRGPSIWDTYTKQQPGKIWDHSDGSLAIDFYHRYKSDIKMVKEVGLDSYRFSISWSRIFPKGKGAVNTLGVKFYNDLINEIIANGLKPFVTLFHWDLPQALEDEYGGFLKPEIVEDFRNYADFCFKTFGDRVKHWVTLNEPYGYSVNGYSGGSFAPGRCSNYVGKCPAGDSSTEPYIVNHHLILAHGAAVNCYKNKYQAHQKGQIGVTIVTFFFEPKSNSDADRKAARRALDFMFGWNGVPIGTPTPLSWLFIYPEGIYKLMTYIRDNYNNPPVYITENGVAESKNDSLAINEARKDGIRIRYHDGHLKSLLHAIKDRVNVKGYYIWSFSDSFEWDAGYTARFGIIYVDYKNNLSRYPKSSAFWLKKFLLK